MGMKETLLKESKSARVDVNRLGVTQLLENANNGRIQTCFEFVRFLDGMSSENHLMLYVIYKFDGGSYGWAEESIPFELHIKKVIELRDELDKYIQWWCKKEANKEIKKKKGGR